MNTSQGKQENERPAAVLISMLLVVLLFFALGLSVWQFNSAITTSLSRRTYTLLEETARFHQKTFSERLYGQFAMLDRLADYLGASADLSHPQLLTLLNTVVKRQEFSKVVFTSTEGVSYASDGTTFGVEDVNYYARVIGGQRFISEPLVTSAGERYHLMGVPVRLAQGTTIGVLYGHYTLAGFNSALAPYAFGGMAYSIVTTAKGEIILHNLATDASLSSGNVLDIFAKSSFLDKGSTAEMKSNLSAGRRATIHYELDGQRRFATYTRLGVNDWFLFSVVPEAVVNTEAEEISAHMIALTIKITLCFAFLLLVILWRHHRSSCIIQQAMQQAQQAREQFEALVENITGGVTTCLCDDKLSITYMSPGFLRLTGYGAREQESIDKNGLIHFVHPEDRRLLLEQFEKEHLESGHGSVEYRLLRQGGDSIWVMDNWRIVQDAMGVPQAHSVFTDITYLREAATRDPLTAAFNKTACRNRIHTLLQESGESECALLMIDIDNFKQVNDTYGHMVGDMVLTSFAQTVRSLIRGADVFGRVGGDEFVVFLTSTRRGEGIQARVQEFCTALGSISVSGATASFSIGVALSPQNGLTYRDLFSRADEVLYTVKHAGKGHFSFYDPHKT